VRLEFECPNPLPKVVADVDQVQQVTLNLLSNALRATPRGGQVRLTLAASSFKTGQGTPEQPSVSLVVQDTGCGISENCWATSSSRSSPHGQKPAARDWGWLWSSRLSTSMAAPSRVLREGARERA
jgi:sensor histidine kinase regulating citrate/malate metabolism